MRTIHTFLRGIFFALVMMTISCSMLTAKKPSFKNSVWENKQEMFVADAGTQTITNTLEFGAGNDVKVKWSSYLPAHPAMYVNRDGSIDKIPASSYEDVKEGTWQYKHGKLTITFKDGSQSVFDYHADMLLGGESFDGSKMAYNRK